MITTQSETERVLTYPTSFGPCPWRDDWKSSSSLGEEKPLHHQKGLATFSVDLLPGSHVKTVPTQEPHSTASKLEYLDGTHGWTLPEEGDSDTNRLVPTH